MTELVKYEAARRALAEAVEVDEVMAIRDQAEAMRHATRIAGDKGLEIQAAQIRFRAEQRLGQLLIAQKETVGLNRGRAGAGRPRLGDSDTEQPKSDDRPTLAEVGIDRKLSSRAQRLAAMDQASFERALEQHAEQMRAGTGRIAMDLHKIGAEERGREARRELAIALSAKSAELPSGRKYAVIYADPPWHRDQGVTSHSYENHYPTMAWSEICALPVADRVLPDAWLFLWIPRAHAFALHEVETEVEVVGTGEVVRAKVAMPLGWAVAQAWGFDAYSTAFVWTKTDEDHPDEGGGAILVRDQDELLLMFKRGRGLPKPEKKYGSNHRERSRPLGHSTKPMHYRRMLADMAGENVPALEMFARFDPENPPPVGWDLWGNQSAAGEPSSAPSPQPDPDLGEGARPNGDGSPAAVDNALAELPSGEVVASLQGDVDMTAAAAVTSDRASTAAAVEAVVAQGAVEAPYNAADVITIDQLAGAEWLEPPAAAAPFDPASLPEREALKILSDFCHARRDIAPALGEFYHPRGFAYCGVKEWSLTGKGWDRLRDLEAADLAAQPRVELTEPKRAAETLFDVARQIDLAPAPEVVDGALQTRLPVDDDELAEQLALLALDAGEAIEPELLRHLVGKGFAHCGITKTLVTDDGRAFLAQLVGPASVQHQGEIAR